MSLYSKHRPDSFEKMKGDYQFINGLLGKKDNNHAFLFFGPSGTGKTTSARICLKNLGMEDFDIDEYNFADTRGIDTVRQIISDSKYGGFHGFIVDEVHKATEEAQQAMLKLLEDIPEKVYFFLCTSEPGKMIKALRDRPSRVQFSSLEKEDLRTLVHEVALAEGTKLRNQVAIQIAEKAEGSARSALNILESVLAMPSEDAMFDYLDKYESIEESTPAMIEIARAVFDTTGTWKTIAPLLRAYKEAQGDAEGLRRTLLA